jgi:hypothetical protein
MIDLRLYDQNFVGDLGSSRYHGPRHVRWLREGPTTKVTFFTDQFLDRDLVDGIDGTKVAWILEPKAINPAPYRYVVEQANRFDLVLTHHADMLSEGDNFVFYPNGMSWIADQDWRRHDKRDGISIIASDKRMTEGHLMRHRVIDKGANLELFGRGYRPIDHKVEALGPYRFSVAIENSAASWYFTEKLLDCFATFTVPIYWGCPGIAKFFDTSGMVVVTSEDEIVDVVSYLARNGRDVYETMLPALTRNHETAKRYKVAEDWIFEHVLVPRGLV